MARTLELTQLRSFVAVADCGGFHRAANALHVSQPTVSHHIRRLEATIGQPLMVREGRTSRLTAAGEMLLADARRMLEIHDEAMRRIGNAPETDEVVVGSTEHAADQLLPELASALQASLGVARIRFRLDRGAVLQTALDRGDVDLALLFGAPDDDRSTGSGRLTLRWYSAPGWAPRPTGPPSRSSPSTSRAPSATGPWKPLPRTTRPPPSCVTRPTSAGCWPPPGRGWALPCSPPSGARRRDSSSATTCPSPNPSRWPSAPGAGCAGARRRGRALDQAGPRRRGLTGLPPWRGCVYWC
ncbi:LysR family transcriptional regulator [Pseudonocardia benzenivorans]